MSARGLARCLLVVLATVVAPAAATADVLHVYDRLGRLRATVDPAANDAAIWTYDSVGNVLAITRQPATQTTILELPTDAVVGACSVRILGIGFSPTPAQNTVTVNGVAATVQSAMATELAVCVGAGTTTGVVAVTTPTGSATSAAPLTVLATAATPTITSVTPGVAVWGTTLSIAGTHLDPGPGRTRLRMGGSRLLAPVASVTTTSLSTTVGPGTTSGRPTVTTPAGTATAAVDLFVPPAPYGASDVAITARWTVGTSQGLTIPASKQALLVFDGTAGQKVCVGQGMDYNWWPETTVYQPDGASLVPAAFYGDTVVEVPPLPVAGTYQIRLRASSTTDVGTTTLYDASDQLQGVIVADGTATTVTVATPCIRAGRTFAGTAGQRISVWTNSTVNGSAEIRVETPAGTTLATGLVGNHSGAFTVEPVPLPQTGTYILWADPAGGSTGTLTHFLFTVVDVTATLALNAAPLPVSLPTPGQRALLDLPNGTAGQPVTVRVTNSSLPYHAVSLLRPDGTTQVTEPHVGGAYTLAPQTLAVVGTYQVVIDPASANTGSLSVQVTSP